MHWSISPPLSWVKLKSKATYRKLFAEPKINEKKKNEEHNREPNA